MDRRFEPYFRQRVEQIGREGLTRVPSEGLVLPSGAVAAMVEPLDTYEAAVFSAVERGMEPFRSAVPELIRWLSDGYRGQLIA